MSVKFTFTPSAKAFPDSKISRTIDVEIVHNEDYPLSATVNGKPLSNATIAHAVAFAIKQRLANSFVNASNAKNDDGGLLPQAEREKLWESMFDKVLAKITDPAANPNWESVFTGREPGEESDPFAVECNRIAAARLRVWAKAKGRALPKANTPEFKTMVARLLDKQRDAIEAEAKRRMAELEAIGELDDFDIE